MTLRALIFDVDGTLAETEEAHRQAFNATFAAADLDWVWSVTDYARLLKTTGGKERMLAHRRAIGSGPTEAEIAVLHRAKTARYVQIIQSGGLDLRLGVRDWLDFARQSGLKLAIATTTSRPNVDALCLACWAKPADQVFDVIAAGDEVAAKKPAPDIYHLALTRLGLAAQDAIAIEDSPMGLASAKAAGLRVVVTPSLYTQDDDFQQADWVVSSLRDADLPADLRAQLGLQLR